MEIPLSYSFLEDMDIILSPDKVADLVQIPEDKREYYVSHKQITSLGTIIHQFFSDKRVKSTLYLNLKLIDFSERPNNDFYHKISAVITHEIIHKVLLEQEGVIATKKWDNLKRKLLDYGTD